MSESGKASEAVFGAGCFWCVEAIFKSLKGISAVESGYSGGRSTNPTYEEVCRGDSQHVEVVKIEFDADVISYEVLLKAFWASHDPTTLNQQGADVGTQYRSVVFYQSEAQKAAAFSEIEIAQNSWKNKIVTAIEPLTNYYSAEDYHQNYFSQNLEQGYCKMVIAPKIAAFRKKFPLLLKDQVED